MRSLAPATFGDPRSSGLNWVGAHVNLLASTFAALELGKQNISVCRVIWAKLLRSLHQIQPVIVGAVHAENVEPHAILNAAAKRCVWTINLHADLLSGGSYYTVNETETNHKLTEVGVHDEE
ncbi:hypothetical protein RI570_21300 [Brucella pseudogrignonensis]|uniref:hypothetical protein n=1 Tax=Brucella pseudogrignonensis TaxID=419475 RepID=UPI0028B967DC|nr:hypothetical protein [Brucella pseudogrignonensis]MDT6940788.1 hypothetical protein [Brucella pseudogrignonensis]MDT6942589.1 hypothetical protein [Brucella pseudogrignonensis]